MKNIYHFILPTFLICCLISCHTSEKALENKRYVRAMNLASKEIKKGNDVEINTYYLQTAAQELVKETIDNYNSKNSPNVKDWKRSRLKFYRVLTQINNNNIKTERNKSWRK